MLPAQLLRKWRDRFAALGVTHPVCQIAMHDTLLDPDDEEAILVRLFMQELGLVRTLGVVANHSPNNDPTFRARATKGLLKSVGYGHIPVVSGTPSEKSGLYGYELDVDPSLLSTKEELFPGGASEAVAAWMLNHQERVDWVLCSRMSDAWGVFDTHPEVQMIYSKLREITFMASVYATVEGQSNIIVDANGRMTTGRAQAHADFKGHYAANWKYDEEAGDRILEFVQINGVKTVFLSRYAAYAVLMPALQYDRLQGIDHPLAQRLYRVRPKAMSSLWGAACRNEWRNRKWFVDSFMAGRDPGPEVTEDYLNIYHHPNTVGFAFYDALATIASHPALRRYFFEPIVQKVQNEVRCGVRHEVIGTPMSPCVKNVGELREFVMDALVYMLSKKGDRHEFV